MITYKPSMDKVLGSLQFDCMTHDSISDINDDWISCRNSFHTITNSHIPKNHQTEKFVDN